ncbi:hypothetical protein [Streptomyces sp. NPDC058674]|uniref:hypothetical protein n=1 Tax=Streptomyces sp. NPDC058674 TaxID=3346592 RepID=UPI003658A924
MCSTTPSRESARRPLDGPILLALGTARYTSDFKDLPNVPDGVRSVVDALHRLGVKTLEGSPNGHLDMAREPMCQLLQQAAESAENVIVYYAGHGVVPERRGFHIVLSKTRWHQLETALDASYLPQLFVRHADAGQPAVLVMLDCCFSAAGGKQVLDEALRGLGSDNVYVMTSSSVTDEAYEGVFPAALANALAQSYEIGSSSPWIPLDAVKRAINGVYPSGKEVFLYHSARGSGNPHFFPNPDYWAGSGGLTTAEQQLAKLRGVPGATVGVYLTGVTGRLNAAQDLARWLKAQSPPHGLLAVTGPAGTGKSALLHLVGYLSDAATGLEQFGEEPDELIAQTAEELKGGLPLVNVQAHGLNVDQIAREIGKGLGRPGQTVGTLLAGLPGHHQPTAGPHQSPPPCLIIDSIDEADRMDVVSDVLLRPLARRLRVAASCRDNKLFALGKPDAVIDLGATRYRDPQALIEYIHHLLIASHEPHLETSYKQKQDDFSAELEAAGRAVAEEIAERATKTHGASAAESFLVGQLMARSVRGQPLVDTTENGWSARLPVNMIEAFEQDIDATDNRAELIRTLLRALAYARGEGLPWENIWVPVAQGLAPRAARSQPVQISATDVRWVLSHMGAYVVEENRWDRSLFRLLHATLADYLRGPKNQDAQAEAAICEALLRTVPEDGSGRRDWAQAHPYLRTYLAQHAAAAGRDVFDRLVADRDFLAVADRLTLSAAFLSLPGGIAMPNDAARLYERARPLLGIDAAANAAYLQEAATALHITDGVPATSLIHPIYTTRKASIRPDMSRWTLTGHLGRVNDVALCDHNGRLLAAATGDDATVRMWNILRQMQLKRLPQKHIGTVNTVAFGITRRKRLLLASAGFAFIRVWDPVKKQQLNRIPAHDGAIRAVAFGSTSRGGLVLASGGDDGTVRLWNPLSGRAIREPLTAHTGSVRSVALARAERGRLILASGGDDGTVRAWDAENHEPIQTLDGHHGRVQTVALHPWRGDLVVASGDDQGVVLVHSAVTGELVCAPDPGSFLGPIRSLALCATSDGGGLLLAVADSRPIGAVQLLDLPQGTPMCPPLNGHGRALRAVSCAFHDGELYVSSASEDGTVRIWQPSSTPTVSPMVPHTGHTESVALTRDGQGQILLASGRGDGNVLLWRQSDNTPVSLGTHEDSVEAVAWAPHAADQPLLVSGSSDGIVRLWNVIEQRKLAEATVGLPVTSLGMRLHEGRPHVAVGAQNGRLWLWDALADEQCELRGHDVEICALRLESEPDGHLRIVSADLHGAVRVQTHPSDAGLDRLLEGSDLITTSTLGIIPETTVVLATGDDRGAVRLTDALTGDPVARAPAAGHTTVRCLALTTRDDTWVIAAASGPVIRLWNSASRAPIVLRRRARVRALAADRNTLAIADGEGISVIEMTDG